LKTLIRPLVWTLSLLIAFPPALALAAAEAATAEDAHAPATQVELLNRLAETGPLESLKPFLKDAMTPTDVTAALAGIYPDIKGMDPAALHPGDGDYPLADWTALLALVREKKGALRSKGLSAWAFEKKLAEITVALTPADTATTPKPALKSAVPVPTATFTPTATPVPVVSVEEVHALKARVSEMSDRLDQLAKDAEKRRQDDDATEKTRLADRAAQKDELQLLRSLLEALQGDLAKVNSRLEEVGKKADEKNLTDTELRQNLSIMRKDLRDNVEDVSILKQKVEKLMAPEKQYARPLDRALTSKWVPGAALLIALGAIVWTATKK